VIDQVNADKFYNQVALPLGILNVGKFVLFGVGLLLIAVSSVLLLRMKQMQKSNDNGYLINSMANEVYKNHLYDEKVENASGSFTQSGTNEIKIADGSSESEQE
jgi:hypothetical protein